MFCWTERTMGESLMRTPMRSFGNFEELTAPLLLYPKRSNVRLVIDKFFAELGVTPRVLMEVDDTEAIKPLVESGFGYSILPEHALRGSSHFFQKFRVAGHRLTRSLALAMAKTDCPRKLTESIASFLRSTLADGGSNGASS